MADILLKQDVGALCALLETELSEANKRLNVHFALQP